MNSEPETMPARSTQEAQTASPVAEICVLLVEDDRSARRYLEVMLQRSGYKVITAADGLEALKLALGSEVDVVVTDAVMPNLGGSELAKFIRKNEKLSRLPIILLTGQENKTSGLSENLIDAFLNKPVKAEELKKCIEGLLGQRS
jgi:two-component system, OmpR family, response regulator